MTRIKRIRRSLRASGRRIKRLACEAAPPFPHWISGADEGESWCKPCGEKRIRDLREAHPSVEYFLDGGYDAQSSDSCCHCEGCGRLLAYTLTSHGVESELEHFRQHAPKAGCPDAAYHVEQMLYGAEWLEDVKAAEEVATVGRAAVRAILAQQGGGDA